MSSLAPITLGMVGLGFASWANGVQLLGVDAKPATEDGPGPTASVAVGGSAMGAITLLYMFIWLVVAAPLGTDGEAVKLGLLFSAISGMYGLLWLGAAVVQTRGWDMRPIGNLAPLCLGLQVIEMGLFASYRTAAGISTAHSRVIPACGGTLPAGVSTPTTLSSSTTTSRSCLGASRHKSRTPMHGSAAPNKARLRPSGRKQGRLRCPLNNR
jgi:hypothetical protein